MPAEVSSSKTVSSSVASSTESTTTAFSRGVLTIATRQSPLALWQAEHIKARLEALYPMLTVHLLTMVTKGDKILDTPLAKIGGKGLFVKELEQALLDGRADIAVHSLKDVPMHLPEGLLLGAYCTREVPTDALVSNQYDSLEALPHGAVVGTASLRRQCQLKAYRPDLTIKSLRGNLGTRLGKLDAGEYDAIVLATSGLMRMKMEARIRCEIPPALSLPAVGQGALAIECRQDDHEVLALLQPLNDARDRLCLMAERSLNRHLEGGCQVPIAAYAIWHTPAVLQSKADDSLIQTQQPDAISSVAQDLRDEELPATQGELWLRGRVGRDDGSLLLKAEAVCQIASDPKQAEAQAEALGVQVAEDLLAQGADVILRALHV